MTSPWDALPAAVRRVLERAGLHDLEAVRAHPAIWTVPGIGDLALLHLWRAMGYHALARLPAAKCPLHDVMLRCPVCWAARGGRTAASHQTPEDRRKKAQRMAQARWNKSKATEEPHE